MSEIHACQECLRRAWLLRSLAPYLERYLGDQPERVADLLALGECELSEALAPQLAAQILARAESLGEGSMGEEIRAAGCWAICRHDQRYPARLGDEPSAPAAIFGRGDIERSAFLGSGPSVAILGARRATSYGREVARSLGSELGEMGVALIGGLSFGIEACAQRGALGAGGMSVAVLPCGADQPYPAAHRSLWRRVAEAGLVLSEHPPGTGPWRWAEAARTRIIAALADFTVIVEAAEGSPALAGASAASELRRGVGAVPGPISSRHSAGPNAVLIDGAHPIRDASDILRAISAAAAGEGAR